MDIESSIKSLVVPAISEVIAFSSFSIQFNKVDFPELGCPNIVTTIPSLNMLPSIYEDIKKLISSFKFLSNAINFFLLANSTSSSLKSSSSSINDAKFTNSSLSLLIFFENPPFS